MSPEHGFVTINSETNPCLVVAQILQGKGLPISISGDAITRRGKKLPGFVQVVATGGVERYLTGFYLLQNIRFFRRQIREQMVFLVLQDLTLLTANGTK